MLKTSLLRNVRKAGPKAGPKVSPKVSPKASRVLALSWRISLRTRFPRVSYILNQHIHDIHYISFDISETNYYRKLLFSFDLNSFKEKQL